MNGREGVIVKEKNDGNVTEEELAFTNLPKEKLLFLQKEFPTNYPFLTRRPSFLKTVFRSSHRSCSVKKDAFRNSRKLSGKHLCKSLFFNKVIKKETLVQVFSCEFCGISKNTYFTEHLRATVSKYLSKGFGEMKKIYKMGISECSLNAAQSTFLTFHTLIIEKEIFSFCLMKLSRSNRLEMFKKGILKTFSKFIGKLLCRSVISYFDLGVIL